MLLAISFATAAHGADKQIGILASKATTLVFEEDIIDVELSSQDYFVKIKGRCLLVRAKHINVPATSLRPCHRTEVAS